MGDLPRPARLRGARLVMPLYDGQDEMLRLPALAPQPRTRIEPATFTYHDERNAARTVHGYGFRPVCVGCEPFPVVASYAMARAALNVHLKNVHRATEREAASPTTRAEAS